MVIKELLPKLTKGWRNEWYIDKAKIPHEDDYPDTNSEFSTKYEDPEVFQAVKEMLDETKEENPDIPAIFTEELPAVAGKSDSVEYGNFLGVYNLDAPVNEYTLASPKKVNKYTDSAVVLHFNEETKQWENVDDVKIIGGYVYAKFKSLSPVAVCTIRKKVYSEGGFVIAQGVPITITANAEDVNKIDITDAFGQVSTWPSNSSILGGTYNKPMDDDGETLITVESGKVANIYGGCFNTSDANVEVKKSKVVMNGGTVGMLLGGSVFKVHTDAIEVSVNGGKVENVGGGSVSYWDKTTGDCNTSTPDVNSPATVDHSRVVITDGDIELVYVAGTSGYMYHKTAYGKIMGGNIGYVLAGSNGVCDDYSVEIEGGHIGIAQSVNRGTVKKAHFDVSGATIDHFFLGGDATDKTVTGKVEAITAEISGGKHNLYAGTTGGNKITAADNIIKEVSIASDVDMTYMEGFDTEFGAVIKKQ